MSNPATIPQLLGNAVPSAAQTPRRIIGIHPIAAVMSMPAAVAPATAIITAIEPWTYHGLLADSYNLIAVGGSTYLGL